MRRVAVLPLVAVLLATTACTGSDDDTSRPYVSMTAAPTSPPPTPGSTVSGSDLAATALFLGVPPTPTYTFTVKNSIELSGPGGKTVINGSGAVRRTETGAVMSTKFVLSGSGPAVTYRTVLAADGLYLEGTPGMPGREESGWQRITPDDTTPTASLLRSQYGSTAGYDPEIQREVLVGVEKVQVLDDGAVDGVTVHQFRHVTTGAQAAEQVPSGEDALREQVAGLTVTTTTALDDQGRVVRLSSKTVGKVDGRDLVQTQVMTFSGYGEAVSVALPKDARVTPLRTS